MFEIIEVGPLEKKRLLRRQYRQLKLRCLKSAICEKLGRTFEGYQRYSTQTYRAEFSEGEIITISVSGTSLFAVGDKLGVDSLGAQGYLDSRFRLVATKG